MTGVEALELARTAGVRFHVNGDKIIVKARVKPPAFVIDLLREHKAEVMALLQREAQSRECEKPAPGPAHLTAPGPSIDEDQVGALIDFWRKRHGRDIPIHNVAPTQTTPLTPERLAKLAATLSAPTPPDVAAHVAARMGVSQESLPREEWWNKPVEGWPRELPITSALTGETVTVKLEDDEA